VLPVFAQTDTVNFIGIEAEAIEAGIAVRWLTQGEYNVENFSIERSQDAINFDSIGLAAANNNTTRQQYDYTDYNIFRTWMYYRIKVNLTNHSSYSDVVAVYRSNVDDLPDIMIYPTISDQYIQVVKITENNFKTANIRIYNLAGHLMLQQPLNSDFLVQTIDISSYNAGAYVLELYDGQYAQKARFIKQN
jgi:hypothetical protein